MGFENGYNYVCVLFSGADEKKNIGGRHILHLRFEQHIKGQVPSTKHRRL